MLDLVQRGAGNASISRMIARQAATAPEAEREGHEAAVAPQPAGGQTGNPAVPPEITAWFGEQPGDDVAVAKWLLEGKAHGFLTFNSAFYEKQIVAISQGLPSVTIKTSTAGDQGKLKIDPKERLGVLIILESQVRGHARRWMAQPSGKRTAVQAGDLLRDLKGKIKDAHAGPSADLYQGFDWDGKDGPAQVLQALSDLPPGSYRIGLPFQGEFFPRKRYLATRQSDAERAAAAGTTPAEITEPSMIKFTTFLYTSKWNPTLKKKDGSVGGWEDQPTGKRHGGVAELISAPLRQGMAALASQGITFSAVFADNNNHLHVTRD